jgi:GT2 family glycosyltransferase
MEIVVIDNASFDGSGEMLRECYPTVRFIQGERNLGFAKANNLAFRETSGRYILFLNPDTEFESGALQRLLRRLKMLPNAGAVGAKLLNTDRTVQTSCIRKFPTILNQMLDAEPLQRRFPKSRLWGTGPLFDPTFQPVEVEAISGACLMIPRGIFEDVGMFSDEYFMYSEDIDLCYKVRQAGWKTYYVPEAVIIHHGGGSSSKTYVNTYSSVMMQESRIRFFRKTRSRGYCWLYRLCQCMASCVRINILLFLWPVLKLCGCHSKINRSLRKWTAVLRWAIGLEKWVENY